MTVKQPSPAAPVFFTINNNINMNAAGARIVLLALTIAYDGTGFHGFQRQPDVRTVENVLFERLRKAGLADNVPRNYSYSGRTDAGVSALWQCVAFEPKRSISCSEIADILSDGKELIVWGCREGVPQGFNARKHALWRDYVYIDDPANYKCCDLEELNSILQRLPGIRIHRFLYKDYKNLPYHYLDRRIIDARCWFFRDHLILWIRGAGFPKHYVRRLVDFLRKHRCGKSFDESVESWVPGAAEPERLFLSGVKYSFDPEETRYLPLVENIVWNVAAKTGLFDPSVFVSFLSLNELVLSPFSRFSPQPPSSQLPL